MLKLRKSKSKKSININPSNIYSYLKKKNYKLKIIGGYYPSNYEINDLEILNYLFFEKKISAEKNFFRKKKLKKNVLSKRSLANFPNRL